MNVASDHDLLIRLDEKVDNVTKLIETYTVQTNDLQLRVRELETKLKIYAAAISVVTSALVSIALKFLQ